MRTIFQVLIECVTVLLLLFTICFFDCKACGILGPQPGIEPTPPILEGEPLAWGLPGQPHRHLRFKASKAKFTASFLYPLLSYTSPVQ